MKIKVGKKYTAKHKVFPHLTYILQVVDIEKDGVFCKYFCYKFLNGKLNHKLGKFLDGIGFLNYDSYEFKERK